MKQMRLEFSIKEMTEKDIDNVLNIDRACFSTSWSREIYEKEIIENDFAHYFVVKTNKKIIGYVGIWLVLDEAQITNIAILPESQGHGIGEKIFGYAIQFMINRGANRLS